MKIFLYLLLGLFAGRVFGEGEPWSVTLEECPVWFSRNELAVPGDTGTLFNLLELTGDGPDFASRLMVDRRINKRHHVRLTLAPIAVEGTGTLNEDVLFRSTTFTPDFPVKFLCPLFH
ncbi:hypothetical protein P3T73_05640 [Kiritimatiellota bacterium B12222]|nr:hypothetical protein P3T73_05640 [Kiritimatiellota bacterium B12222]